MKSNIDILLACIIILLAILISFLGSVHSKARRMEAKLHEIDYNIKKTYDLVSPYIDYKP